MENTDPSKKPKDVGGVISFLKLHDCYELEYATGEAAKLYILNNHVFRFYMSPSRTFLEYPVPINPEDTAKINSKTVADYGSKAFQNSTASFDMSSYVVDTGKVQICFDMKTSKVTIKDKRNNKDVLIESEPLSYNDNKSTQTLLQREDEYFFGGGMQNGRFTHKSKVINIVNSNIWVDGGVTSPCPFYWSTYGYGVLRNTWQPGIYDFGSKSPEYVKTIHKEEDFDVFYFINSQPEDLLRDYYELTGQPIFMPEYAFYEAHLNAFNRDYWVKVAPNTTNAILFEDGYYYKCYQPKEIGDREGVLESLNGENNNYQFSARAMVDRYKMHDMPLGWFVPNDGYGSGYGQTDSLLGDIENLKQFAEYARMQGVEVALWTESNLHPADPEHPKKGERDLGKEVGMAGVVALKCDVAWVGSGYSFGLNAVEDATKIFINSTKKKSRPMIIMVDGWAGTQRYSGIWSGDQKGGEWEYIRFHIPTYIGSGLSGLPVIGSDMDGIYTGGNREVNIRDYQWKAFTPLQLNMDGWGNKPKTPFTYDEIARDINRAYLKLKSSLMPYNYTIGHDSIDGLPMIRAMFLEFPSEPSAFTIDSQYQYMWGPYILVAPIYNEEKVGTNSVRDLIYLPDKNQIWIDFFTGRKYFGGKILNNILCPLWKIPVFIKSGAILPMVNSNNNPNEIKRDYRIFTLYPDGDSKFEVYEDDGMTSDYLQNHYAKTYVTVIDSKSNNLYVNIGKTQGSYKGMIKERATLIQIMTTSKCQQIKVVVNGISIEVPEAKTEKEFDETDSSHFFKDDFVVNPYFKNLDGKELYQKCKLIKIKKIDVTENEIQLKIKDYTNETNIFDYSAVNEEFEVPSFTDLSESTATTITLYWEPIKDAEFFEIERDGVIFTNLIGNTFTFRDFGFDSKHSFKIRSASTDNQVSKWSDSIEVVTKRDPFINTIKGVKVECNIPCQPNQSVCKLTDGDLSSMWHTNWGDLGRVDPEKNHYLVLTFDLGDVYEINKVEYVPRDDAGNGTFLELQYKLSVDNKKWSEPSNIIFFPQDETVKTIQLNGTKFRYMALKIFNTVGGFGSGRQVLFYKQVTDTY